jgi:hypothetical protein
LYPIFAGIVTCSNILLRISANIICSRTYAIFLTKNLSVITKEFAPKVKKTLTKHDEYRRLLYTIGISREPLSSTQLSNALGSKYIFEMLKELCPTEYTKDKILLKFEDLIENCDNGRYKCKLIKKVNQVFGLGWHVEENNLDQETDYQNNNALIEFKFGLTKTTNNSQLLLLTISHGRNNIIAISLDAKEKNTQRNARLDIIFKATEDSAEIKKSFKLATERHKNKTSIYTLKRTRIAARYLDVTLKSKVEKMIFDKRKQFEGTVSELKKQGGDYYPPAKNSDIALAEYFPDIAEMRDNRENWRYSLNLRGLLLYLFHESNIIFLKNSPIKNLSIYDKRKYDKRKREAKDRIREVISNPLIIKKAPFLNFWWYFEEAGFNVVDLLLDISHEYINQLHIDAEHDNYLLRRITERFFIELENFFYRFSDPTFSAYFIKKLGPEEYDKILDKSNDYREIIISYQKDWIRKQQEVIDYFDKKCKSFRLEKELYNTIDALEYDDNSIISIDTLAQKYEMPSKDIHDFIFFKLLGGRKESNRAEVQYYEHRNKQYMIAGSYLISRPKVDKLKSLLFDGMDIKHAYSILHKHNIPQSCSYDLIG